MSDIKPQIREAHRAPSRINAPNTTPRSVLFSLWKTKVKAKILNKKKKSQKLCKQQESDVDCSKS